jgi:hypothetical protein
VVTPPLITLSRPPANTVIFNTVIISVSCNISLALVRVVIVTANLSGRERGVINSVHEIIIGGRAEWTDRGEGTAR